MIGNKPDRQGIMNLMPAHEYYPEPVTVQRFVALQGELIGLVELDYMGLTPKLEQIIRAFEFTQIELAVYRDRGYAQRRGVGQPEADRCALACAFLAKAVLDLKTTRALIDRLQADSKLRRLCGFDLRFALPSESTFSRAFEAFARDELILKTAVGYPWSAVIGAPCGVAPGRRALSPFG